MFIFLLFFQSQLADSLFKNGYYDLSEIEYKRILFFDPALYKNLHIRVNYTLSILHNHRLKGLDEINNLIKDFPEMDEEMRILIGRNLIDLKLYSSAIEIISKTTDKKLLGYCYLMNGQLYEAYETFYKAGYEEICKEIEWYIKKPKKSIFKATILSTFLPGTGEYYAGSSKSAFFDFLLTWGSGYLLYDAVREKRYVDAGVIFGLLFNRFYLGSISNASRIAYERNKREKENWLEGLKEKYFKR